MARFRANYTFCVLMAAERRHEFGPARSQVHATVKSGPASGDPPIAHLRLGLASEASRPSVEAASWGIGVDGRFRRVSGAGEQRQAHRPPPRHAAGHEHADCGCHAEHITRYAHAPTPTRSRTDLTATSNLRRHGATRCCPRREAAGPADTGNDVTPRARAEALHALSRVSGAHTAPFCASPDSTTPLPDCDGPLSPIR